MKEKSIKIEHRNKIIEMDDIDNDREVSFYIEQSSSIAPVKGISFYFNRDNIKKLRDHLNYLLDKYEKL